MSGSIKPIKHLRHVPKPTAPGSPPGDGEPGAENDEGGIEDKEIRYDLQTLRRNIRILRNRLRWSGSILVNISPYYPAWVYSLRKPWIGLDHDEAFLFFYALALSMQFGIITLTFGFKFVKTTGNYNENKENTTTNSTAQMTPEEFHIFYECGRDQIILEFIMFVLTFFLFVYYQFKSYCYVYYWVLAKCFYFSGTLYGIIINMKSIPVMIGTTIWLSLDIYVTISIMIHSLIDYARIAYTHAVLEDVLKEEILIAKGLTDDQSKMEQLVEDL